MYEASPVYGEFQENQTYTEKHYLNKMKKLRQEDKEFKASLGYIMSSCLKINFQPLFLNIL